MARSRNTGKYEFNGNSMYRNLVKDDPEIGNHVAAKVAYSRTEKYSFSIKEAIAEWIESESDTSRGDNPLSS